MISKLQFFSAYKTFFKVFKEIYCELRNLNSSHGERTTGRSIVILYLLISSETCMHQASLGSTRNIYHTIYGSTKITCTKLSSIAQNIICNKLTMGAQDATIKARIISDITWGYKSNIDKGVMLNISRNWVTRRRFTQKISSNVGLIEVYKECVKNFARYLHRTKQRIVW